VQLTDKNVSKIMIFTQKKFLQNPIFDEFEGK